MAEKAKPSVRFELLDVLRGLTLFSMIGYHFSWDLVNLSGLTGFYASWFHSSGAFVWQQSICWSFILLSGFCAPLAHHPFRRNLEIFVMGAIVSTVTLFFLPEDRVVFGILTFLGSAGLLISLWGTLLRKIRIKPFSLNSVPFSAVWLAISLYLFYSFRWLRFGCLQFFPGVRLTLPAALYRGYAASFFGFQDPEFWSTDYFPLLPWLFLYLAGLWTNRLCAALGILSGRGTRALHFNIPGFSWLGRRSLLIYLLHQPVLYGILLFF